jgi:hypothetical protein
LPYADLPCLHEFAIHFLSLKSVQENSAKNECQENLIVYSADVVEVRFITQKSTKKTPGTAGRGRCYTIGVLDRGLYSSG